MTNDLQERLEKTEAQFSEATQQEEFFRAKAEEAHNLRQQLIGRAALLRELLSEYSEEGEDRGDKPVALETVD